MKYRVFSLDVWGNAVEGYEVNDRCRVGTIELPPDANDNEIRVALIEGGYLKNTVRTADMAIEGDDSLIMVDDARDGRPVLQLECEVHRG